MYEYFYGKITRQIANYIVVDVSGVGYKLFTPNPYRFKENEEYKVYAYNHVREDENSLYGFKSNDELELFLKLLNVKGLGPRLASNFFATGSIGGIVDAINRENLLYLTKFPKVGEKLAKQIILDLKGKINIEVSEEDSNNTEDLFNVLESLGYKTAEIKRIIKDVDQSKKLEEQVKDALKLLLK